MRIPCPLCGPRDLREFTYRGAAEALERPAADAPPEAWDRLLHLRDNPAGRIRDLWYHDCCGSWLVVERCTVTHRVFSARPAGEVADAG